MSQGNRNQGHLDMDINKAWPEDIRRSRRNDPPPASERNPYACFGRKPHIMDFDDKDEYLQRLSNWQQWEEKHAG